MARTAALALGAAALTEARLSESSAANPIARVTNLLKEMSATLHKDMEEDEGLYDKMKCWCANGSSEKEAEIKASKEKIAELEATIESLTARTAGDLTTEIKEIEAEVAADKEALEEATGLREKQLKEFQNMEDESIQAIENMKGAITVLSKHQDDGFLQTSLSFLQSWTETHKAGDAARSLDEFMTSNDIFDTLGDNYAPARSTRKIQVNAGFLQRDGAAKDDAVVVRT